ncbi:MAG: flagellar biosynthetic protein FliR [Vibrio sp.]
MDITFTQMAQLIGHVWWPFMRFCGLFLIVPIFGDRAIPAQVRLLLAFIFGLICSPLIKDVPAFNPFSLNTAVLSATQLIFGFAFGLAVTLFMTIFTMAGQAISMQMGLAMAVMNDPSNGVSIAIIGRIFHITSTLLFLAFDAHLVILSIFADSFTYWPIQDTLPFDSFDHILKMVSWMFSSSLIVAIPAIITMLLNNVTFGFMNRAAPALNIFALGFPMTMILGLVALTLSISGVGDMYFSFVLEMNDHLRYLLRLAQ